MGVDELILEIEKKSGLSREEIKRRIEEKIEKFNNLLTVEGAVYLVGRELGIELPSERRKVKIGSILPGIKRLSFVGRVFKISKIVEFDFRGKKGRVVNLFVGDDSGYVKIPLWNDQVDYVDQGKIKIGSVVQIINAYSKDGGYGEVEVGLGATGLIKVIEDTNEIPSAEELFQKFSSYERVKIKDVKKGNVEIIGFIVKVFKANYIVQSNGENFLVIPTLVDDGTGDLRVVFFRELAEQLINSSLSEIEKIPEEERKKFIEKRVLGREILLQGRVKNNEILDRYEMIVTSLNLLNYTEESYKLVEELENA